jgi:hypothetical protein
MDDGVHESHGLDIWAVWIWRTGVLHLITIWQMGSVVDSYSLVSDEAWMIYSLVSNAMDFSGA